MCGISGVYEYKRQTPISPSVMGEMLHLIRHRGPDDEGVYIEDGLALGMRRLSIIDLEGGKQPIFNEDGSVVIVFNGEIYNYLELARVLQENGHQFKTISDTEVIVHLYEEYGDECVQHLRGMFAFALWDMRKQRLLVVRDRLGVKPLYYTNVNQRLIFGSEIKSILHHPMVQARPNLGAIANYLAIKYTPAPDTMFAGIYSLPPGHLLVCDANGVRTRQYWDVSFAHVRNGETSEGGYVEELTALLRESVRLRLRSDVPFGAFLSGGLDSSTIVALMSEQMREPVKTFTVGFESTGGITDELPYARRVAQLFETDHHEILIQARDFVDLTEKIVWHLDQPIADQATVATYMVSQLASRHVKMVLSGEGGDELFAGYARYAGERFAPVFSHLPGLAKSLLLTASDRIRGLRRPKIAIFALCQHEEAKRYANWFPLFNEEMRAQLFAEDFHTKLNGSSINTLFAEHLTRTDATGPLNRMLYVDTKLWLADYLLLRGDKLTMACSLEAREPLLDHKLVEFAATLPPALKLKGWTRKYLLRKAASQWLPAEILERKKQGFTIPTSQWLRKEARSFLNDLLDPATIRRRGMFNPVYVAQLIKEHEEGSADHGNLLWGLINLELWQRLFLDRAHMPMHTPMQPVA